LRSRVLLAAAAAAIAAIGVSAPPAGASMIRASQFHCNTTVNGGVIDSNLVATDDAVCILNGVTVNGNVGVGPNAYFESNGSTISGNVTGDQALTLYIWNKSRVDGNVVGNSAAQVFVWNSTVGKSISVGNSVAAGYGHFQVCGSTIGISIGASYFGPDILVGDPAAGCKGNTVTNGSIVLQNNTPDQELFVLFNLIKNTDLIVVNNTSSSGVQRVHGNELPNGDLVCQGNGTNFEDGGNGANIGVGAVQGGQCTANIITGADNDLGDGAWIP
jgi:hypothetical protein